MHQVTVRPERATLAIAPFDTPARGKEGSSAAGAGGLVCGPGPLAAAGKRPPRPGPSRPPRGAPRTGASGSSRKRDSIRRVSRAGRHSKSFFLRRAEHGPPWIQPISLPGVSLKIFQGLIPLGGSPSLGGTHHVKMRPRQGAGPSKETGPPERASSGAPRSPAGAPARCASGQTALKEALWRLSVRGGTA